MPENTSALSTEINRLVAAVNTYNNTSVQQFGQLLAAYGLTEPLTLAQVQGLTLRQLGQIQEAVAGIIGQIGKEVGTRTTDANLAAIGYASFDAAIADCPNWFGPSAVAEAQNNLTRVKNMLAVLDTLVDAASVFDSLTKIAAIRDSVADTAAHIARV